MVALSWPSESSGRRHGTEGSGNTSSRETERRKTADDIPGDARDEQQRGESQKHQRGLAKVWLKHQEADERTAQ